MGIEVQLYPIPRHIGMDISSQRASFFPTPTATAEAPTTLPLDDDDPTDETAPDPPLLLLDSCAQSILVHV